MDACFDIGNGLEVGDVGGAPCFGLVLEVDL